MVLRFVPSRCRPLMVIALAGASATRQTRHGGPQVRPPSSGPSPSTGSATMRYLTPAPSMTRRWPRTGSACGLAIRFRNADWLRCSDEHLAAGRERESLTHDKGCDPRLAARPGHGLTGGAGGRTRSHDLPAEKWDPAVEEEVYAGPDAEALAWISPSRATAIMASSMLETSSTGLRRCRGTVRGGTGQAFWRVTGERPRCRHRHGRHRRHGVVRDGGPSACP
jgi:hypothetical protein